MASPPRDQRSRRPSDTPRPPPGRSRTTERKHPDIDSYKPLYQSSRPEPRSRSRSPPSRTAHNSTDRDPYPPHQPYSRPRSRPRYSSRSRSPARSPTERRYRHDGTSPSSASPPPRLASTWSSEKTSHAKLWDSYRPSAEPCVHSNAYTYPLGRGSASYARSQPQSEERQGYWSRESPHARRQGERQMAGDARHQESFDRGFSSSSMSPREPRHRTVHTQPITPPSSMFASFRLKGESFSDQRESYSTACIKDPAASCEKSEGSPDDGHMEFSTAQQHDGLCRVTSTEMSSPQISQRQESPQTPQTTTRQPHHPISSPQLERSQMQPHRKKPQAAQTQTLLSDLTDTKRKLSALELDYHKLHQKNIELSEKLTKALSLLSTANHQNDELKPQIQDYPTSGPSCAGESCQAKPQEVHLQLQAEINQLRKEKQDLQFVLYNREQQHMVLQEMVRKLSENSNELAELRKEKEQLEMENAAWILMDMVNADAKSTRMLERKDMREHEGDDTTVETLKLAPSFVGLGSGAAQTEMRTAMAVSHVRGGYQVAAIQYEQVTEDAYYETDPMYGNIPHGEDNIRLVTASTQYTPTDTATRRTRMGKARAMESQISYQRGGNM